MQCSGTIPDGQTYVFVFNKKDGTQVTQSKSATYSFDSNDLDLFQVGEHSCRIFEVQDGSSVLLETVRVWISPGLTSEVSKSKEILDKITAVIEGRAEGDVQSYTIAGRSIQKMQLPDLLKLQNKYSAIVADEESAFASGALVSPKSSKFKTVQFKFTR